MVNENMLVVAGAAAGLAVGYALQRGDVCFHSAFRGLYERRYALFKVWLLAVAVGVVGLTAVFELGPWDGLNRGLPFRPVANIGGGLMIGVGMVVAASCNSGLFYKLGAGMLGSAVGLVGWGFGELAGARVSLPGPTVLGGGDAATVPGTLGVSRWLVALPLAALIVLLLSRTGGRGGDGWRLGWPAAGVLLGVALVASWVAAGAGGASFGASTVGAVDGVAAGRPPWWLVTFLAALVAGSALGALTSGGWWLRGERPVRYAQLAVGGFLLGAGARIGGGCNLGHGLSGVAQLNVSSLVVVASIVAGIGIARSVQLRLLGVRDEHRELHWTQRTRSKPQPS